MSDFKQKYLGNVAYEAIRLMVLRESMEEVESGRPWESIDMQDIVERHARGVIDAMVDGAYAYCGIEREKEGPEGP